MTSRHFVCDLQDLPEGSRVILPIGGPQGVGVYNIRGSLVAIPNVCPHAGAPLCQGELTGAVVSEASYERHWAHEGEILKCPWHGWEFKLPEGVTLTDPPFRLKTYPIIVEDGKVIVEVGGTSRERASVGDRT